eukprot:15144428-Ditylum_brightwellii.AAC.1
MFQPNTLGFQALITRGGEQLSKSSQSKCCDLDYTLKLTARTIPDHLQCGICHPVLKNAMLLPWDREEGLPACE